MKIKVAIAEDNDFLATSFEEKLKLFDNQIEFKFRGKNGNDLLKKLEENHNIDIILMDIEMPEMDGILTTEIVSQKYPQIKTIILTIFDDEEKIFKSIQSGAIGYLLKDEKPITILNGITMALEGGAPMSPIIAYKSLELLRNPNRISLENSKEDFALSKREIEVLEQLSQGLDYNEISENLFISPSTVRKHIENIYKKLHVNNKMKAVKKALKHNII
ncbi:MAG: DNA-binding response regulator [Ignavibacteriales bacterium CG18_big_fil_WC_8_21_14_2_50_31_20]|nr:MAG: DNA-binding response regulator [Ignavibacteriales bacterium CG18_big_fil_WC_8_21_14_2_50_31_20]